LNSRGRVPELDGIRGMAILMVLVYHGFASSMVVAPYAWTGFARWVEFVASVGWMGVDLFFVLSGFLITGILLDSIGKPHYFQNFYARRALRILPLYYLTLIFIAILSKGSGTYVLLGCFYLSNIAPLFAVPVIYGPLWSLSVEEHFYLIWPWLIPRLKVTGIAVLAAVVCVLEPVIRAITYHYWVAPGGQTSYLSGYSWLRFDGLAAGALLAAFVRSKYYSQGRLYSISLTCIGSAVMISAFAPPHTLLNFSLVYTVSTLFGAAVLTAVLSGAFRLVTAVFYCVWDWIAGEYPAWLVSKVGPFATTCIRAAVVFAVCFVFAEFSSRYFEGPILKLKRHFVSSKPELGAVTAVSAEVVGTR
jgi:peptidoglycan/LPS O-acetylase OafA/YrhL